MPASHATAHETHRAPIPSHRRHYKASTFNTCELPLRDGPLDPHTSTSLQSHCTGRKMLKDCDVRLGVLEQVPVGEQVTWCHRMVTCAKKDGSLRRTILWMPMRHAKHTTPNRLSINIQKDRVEWITLHPADRHFTTFITLWGRYQYRQGYIASGTRRYDEIVALIERKTRDRSLDISKTCLKEKTLRYMSYIPGVKNRAPNTTPREPPHQTSKMISAHSLSNSTLRWWPCPTASPQTKTQRKHNSWFPRSQHRHLIRCNYVHTDGGRSEQCTTTPLCLRRRRDLQGSHRDPQERLPHSTPQGTSAMTTRAEAEIFWPGITADIHQTRSSCSTCNRMAPSQAALPPTQPTPSEYPFICVCVRS